MVPLEIQILRNIFLLRDERNILTSNYRNINGPIKGWYPEWVKLTVCFEQIFFNATKGLHLAYNCKM